MSPIAFILDGAAPPSYFESQLMIVETQLVLCVFVPTLCVLVSSMLIRWKKKGILAALALAVVSALGILIPAQDIVDWGYPYASRWPSKVVPWVAALIPFAAIAVFCRSRDRRIDLKPISSDKR